MTDVIARSDLTPPQLDALHVLSTGTASITNRTELDIARGIRCVQSRIAQFLVDAGLAEPVPHWNAIEITELGRNVLAGT